MGAFGAFGRALSAVRTNMSRTKRQAYLQKLKDRGLRIADDVTIEDGFFLDPSHCYLIEIQGRCILGPNVRLIAHDASTKHILNATRLGKILIEEGCFIGDSAIVLPGVTIGKGSIIGAGSIVTRSIPPDSVAVGSPARVICPVSEYRDRQAAILKSGRYFGPEYGLESATRAHVAEIAEAAKLGPIFIA